MALLENKKALVTGSSRGIGKAIAMRYMQEGCEVWGLCTKPSANKAELEAYAAQNGTKFHEIYANCGNAEELAATVKAALAEAGSFDILVNNAGITRDGLLMRMKDEDWDAIMATNLTSVYRMSKAVMRSMMKARWGRIVNISSVVGLSGNPGQCNYSAAKAGVIGFTKSMAREVASRGITVNAVAPGFIATDMTSVLSDDVKNALLAGVPCGRLGDPTDIANAVLYLASDGASYVTGETINVNGGMLMD